MAEEHLNFLLSSITEFDEMKNKRFELKKCETSERIEKLKTDYGFSKSEPLNARNLHRIIPAAKEIHLTLGESRKRKAERERQNIAPKKVCIASSLDVVGQNRNSGSLADPRLCSRSTTNRRISMPHVKESNKKIDVVGRILSQSASSLSSRKSLPNATKSSAVKVPTIAHTNFRSTVLLPGSLTGMLAIRNPVQKDKEFSSEISDDKDGKSSQESGISSQEELVGSAEKENEIPDLWF